MFRIDFLSLSSPSVDSHYDNEPFTAAATNGTVSFSSSTVFLYPVGQCLVRKARSSREG